MSTFPVYCHHLPPVIWPHVTTEKLSCVITCHWPLPPTSWIFSHLRQATPETLKFTVSLNALLFNNNRLWANAVFYKMISGVCQPDVNMACLPASKHRICINTWPACYTREAQLVTLLAMSLLSLVITCQHWCRCDKGAGAELSSIMCHLATRHSCPPGCSSQMLATQVSELWYP